MRTFDTVLQLGVDVEGHFRVGVADLVHDPEHVEVIGEEGDRDIGASEGVRGNVRQGRQATGLNALGGEGGGVRENGGEALAGGPAAAGVGEGPGVRAGWMACAA